MKKVTVISLFFLLFSFLNTEGKIKLRDCHNQAIDKYPLKKQLDYYGKLTNLKIQNLNSGYYPELSVLSQAQYQSDVTKVELNIQSPLFKIPQVPVPPKDQYKIGININQIIWDGGIISGQKSVEQAQGLVNIQSVEVELYNLKQRVNDAFFGILIQQKRIKSLELSYTDLSEKLKTIKIKVENGTMLQASADILEAELLKISQTLTELNAAKKTMLDILGELINQRIEPSEELEVPQDVVPELNNDFSKRPEYKSFILLKNQLDETQNLIDAKYLPKLSFFAQGMYAKPGLNMFDPDWQPYYIAGLKASWNFWNWGNNSRENEILTIQKDVVNTQEQAFSRNLNIAVAKYINDIEKTGKLIEKDVQIISLREKITKNAGIQLENGVITATEFLSEYNSESQAKLSLDIHKLELLQSGINYMTMAGKEIK